MVVSMPHAIENVSFYFYFYFSVYGFSESMRLTLVLD